MSSKTRILVVIGNLDMGGAERHLLRVMPEINKTEFEVLIYTTNSRGVLANKVEAAGVSVISPPLSKQLLQLGKLGKPIIYLISWINLIRIIKKYKPTIIHYFLPGAYLLGSAAAYFNNVKYSVMSRRIIYTEEYRKSVYFRLEKRMHKRLTVALACSKEIASELEEEGIAKNKIGIIYNGVDINCYHPMQNTDQLKKNLFITHSPLVMVILANLYKRKGHIDLLHALSLIKDQLPQGWKLLAIGRDGGERQALERTTATLGLSKNVQWLGLRLDSHAILSLADFGILSSHEEGFSNALLECMACGLPMVVTDVSGSNEAVIDGQNGLVVPIANPPRLAEAILQLANSEQLRAMMSKNTKNRVETLFSLDQVIDSYYIFYKTLVTQGHPSDSLFPLC